MQTDINLAKPFRLCGLLAEKPTLLSESMHNAGFLKLNLDYHYMAFSISNIESAIQAMRSMKFRGYSVTIPFKESIIPYLDELTNQAKTIGAVNTVINENGKLVGHNTDWIGISEAINETKLKTFDSALLIGAGGAAKAAAYYLQDVGIKTVDVTNRNTVKAEAFVKKHGFRNALDFSTFGNHLNKYSLIINSTPVTEFNYINSSSFRDGQCIFDMITRTTPLLQNAKEGKATTIEGTRMLLYQALEQFKLFTKGEIPPKKEMEKALNLAANS